jgi:hypothetical protein
MPEEPVIRYVNAGQPMVRTGAGPRFGFKEQRFGPFENAGARITTGAIDGLAEVAQEIMDQSMMEVPVDFGTLKRSARFSMSETVTGEVEIVMGYGFGDEIEPRRKLPAAGYAVPVHEIMEHEHEPPTKAKFLEDPVLEHAYRLQPVMADKIKAMLLGSGKGFIPFMDIVSGVPLIFDTSSPE